jgi:hypothetical protein
VTPHAFRTSLVNLYSSSGGFVVVVDDVGEVGPGVVVDVVVDVDVVEDDGVVGTNTLGSE